MSTTSKQKIKQEDEISKIEIKTPISKGALSKIKSTLSNVISAYVSDFVGREKEIRLMMLSLIAKEHIYIVSPPGTGKTMLRAVAESFGFDFFYYLMNYDVKVEDIIAYPKIKRIKQNDGSELIKLDYEPRKPGLATSEVVYLDEMFKASTPILNALLGILNERRVTIGNKEMKVPLWTLIGASNEIPSDPALHAFLDRFLFRDFVKYISKEQWFEYLIKYWSIHQPGYQRVKLSIPKDIIIEANRLIWNVDIYGVLDDYLKIIDKLKEKGIEISDRRKGRILKAMAASAILDGRDYVDPTDLEVLVYTIPTNEDEYNVVLKVVDEVLGGLMKTKNEILEIIKQVKAIREKATDKDMSSLVNYFNTVNQALSRIVHLNVPSLEKLVKKATEEIELTRMYLVDVIASKVVEYASKYYD